MADKKKNKRNNIDRLRVAYKGTKPTPVNSQSPYQAPFWQPQYNWQTGMPNPNINQYQAPGWQPQYTWQGTGAPPMYSGYIQETNPARIAQLAAMGVPYQNLSPMQQINQMPQQTQYNPNAYDVRPQGQPGNVSNPVSSTSASLLKNYYFNKETGQWAIAPGAYDYALSYTNLGTSPGNITGALNSYGQPVGTLAPIQKTRQFSNNPQFATGTAPMPSLEELQAQLAKTQKRIANYQYTGKQGSYTAARSGRRLKLLKRRAGLLKDAVGTQPTGYGVQGASSGNLVNWSI